MGRRPAAQHRSNSNAARSIPLCCADYAFVRDAQDEELATLLIGRPYPSRSLFATVCEAEGNNEASIWRLSSFFRETGLQNWVCNTDQESSVTNVVDEALPPDWKVEQLKASYSWT